MTAFAFVDWRQLIYTAFSQVISLSSLAADWNAGTSGMPIVPRLVLLDAVRFRMYVAVEENIYDYHESLRACIRRLESAN